MSFTEKANEIRDFLGSTLQKLWGWVSDPQTAQQAQTVIRLIGIIIAAVGALNEPIPKRDRPKVVRLAVDLLRIVSLQDLETIVEAKRSGGLDVMTNPKLDALIGELVSSHVEIEKGKKLHGGKTSTVVG